MTDTKKQSLFQIIINMKYILETNQRSQLEVESFFQYQRPISAT